jgi:hypothetical protein
MSYGVPHFIGLALNTEMTEVQDTHKPEMHGIVFADPIAVLATAALPLSLTMRFKSRTRIQEDQAFLA